MPSKWDLSSRQGMTYYCSYPTLLPKRRTDQFLTKFKINEKHISNMFSIHFEDYKLNIKNAN